jgi:hypothetical protein
VNYDASPTVGKFLGCDDPYRLIVGPVGSGKSSGCCIESVKRSLETPPGEDGVHRARGVIVRNTYRELEDTTIKTFKEWVPEGEFGAWRGGDMAFDLLFETDEGARCETEILFRALDRPDHVKKLLSMELTWAYFNEWKEIPASIFQVMKQRVGRYPRREEVPRYWSGIFGDTNPMDTDHYLYRLFEEERAPGHRVFRQPGGLSANAENIRNLAHCWAPEVPIMLTGERRREYIRKAKDEAFARIESGDHESPCVCYYVEKFHGTSADYKSVMRDGNYGFVKEGKPIYDEFNDAIHVATEPIPLLSTVHELIIGNDFGLTPAAIWMQQDPADGQWQVIREYVSERMAAVEFGREQVQICKKEYKTITTFRGWGDPAGMAGSQTDDTTPIDVVSSQGMPMAPAPTNDFMLRREAVAGLLTKLTRLGRPALIISPTCKILRKGMGGGYCYRRLKVSGDERFEDHPLKNRFSHVCEALQYAAVGEGEDHNALDGGHERRVSVNVRVHRSIGGGKAGGVVQGGGWEDGDRPLVVRPSIKRR